MKWWKKLLCRYLKHKGEVTSYLPWIVVGINSANWCGTAGYCKRCGYEWDDTGDSVIPPIQGDGRPKVYYYYGKDADW